MTDRELLELAAKAAGFRLFIWGAKGSENFCIKEDDGTPGNRWNPLTDDGDALRLAVKLGIATIPYPIYAKPKHSVIAKQYNLPAFLREYDKDINISEIEMFNDDPYAATRRAIVRAAAEIGRTM